MQRRSSRTARPALAHLHSTLLARLHFYYFHTASTLLRPLAAQVAETHSRHQRSKHYYTTALQHYCTATRLHVYTSTLLQYYYTYYCTTAPTYRPVRRASFSLLHFYTSALMYFYHTTIPLHVYTTSTPLLYTTAPTCRPGRRVPLPPSAPSVARRSARRRIRHRTPPLMARARIGLRTRPRVFRRTRPRTHTRTRPPICCRTVGQPDGGPRRRRSASGLRRCSHPRRAGHST